MHSIRTANYRQELENAIGNAKSVDIAVAFASEQGIVYGHIKQKLIELLEKGGTLRVIVDLKLSNTDPEFLANLLKLQAKGFQVEFRSYTIEADGVFHPKVYLFELQDGSVRLVLGSANWTKKAYTNNIEYGLVIQGDHNNLIIKDAQKFFNDLWISPNAKRIDFTSLDIYRNYWRSRRGLDNEIHRRSSSLWRKLQKHLASSQTASNLKWPTNELAMLLGCLAARGSIDRKRKNMTIYFRYGGRAYRHENRRGYIGKGRVSYKASNVVHLVPEAVARQITKAVFPATPKIEKLGQWKYEIIIDCKKNPQFLEYLRMFFGGKSDYRSFPVPNQIIKADAKFQKEFIRGYALVCGLVSGGTYDPTHNHQVWLRPTNENAKQFDGIVDLLHRELHIPAYVHWRTDRDVAVKIKCESWLNIGFGVDWLDAIVKEGARLNAP